MCFVLCVQTRVLLVVVIVGAAVTSFVGESAERLFAVSPPLSTTCFHSIHLIPRDQARMLFKADAIM